MGSEFGGTEVDLRYRTVHHVAATRCGNHSGFSREVSGVGAVVCYIAFGNIKQVQTETAEVDDAHEGYAVIFGQGCIDFTGDDAGVFVQQVPNLLNVQDSVSRIGAENKVGSGQATMCQQFAHSFYIAEEIAGLAVPNIGNSVGVVGSAVVELHGVGFAGGVGVDVLLHGAGVVNHGLCGHPFFTTGNTCFHVCQVVFL